MWYKMWLQKYLYLFTLKYILSSYSVLQLLYSVINISYYVIAAQNLPLLLPDVKYEIKKCDVVTKF